MVFFFHAARLIPLGYSPFNGSLDNSGFLQDRGPLDNSGFLGSYGSLCGLGFLGQIGLGCAVDDSEFGFGVFGAGFEAF